MPREPRGNRRAALPFDPVPELMGSGQFAVHRNQYHRCGEKKKHTLVVVLSASVHDGMYNALIGFEKSKMRDYSRINRKVLVGGQSLYTVGIHVFLFFFCFFSF